MRFTLRTPSFIDNIFNQADRYHIQKSNLILKILQMSARITEKSSIPNKRQNKTNNIRDEL